MAYYALKGIICHSRGSDNIPPGSSAGGEGRSEPIFEQRNRSPGLANGFSLEVFFDIADALEVDPAGLINASIFPDQLLKKK